MRWTSAQSRGLTDISGHPTAEGKLCCRAIEDLFSNRIDGSAIDERTTARLAATARRTAVARHRPKTEDLLRAPGVAREVFLRLDLSWLVSYPDSSTGIG
jgi:transposase InsO family protein